jgi:hypothetical protein
VNAPAPLPAEPDVLDAAVETTLAWLDTLPAEVGDAWGLLYASKAETELGDWPDAIYAAIDAMPYVEFGEAEYEECLAALEEAGAGPEVVEAFLVVVGYYQKRLRRRSRREQRRLWRSYHRYAFETAASLPFLLLQEGLGYPRARSAAPVLPASRPPGDDEQRPRPALTFTA